MPYSVQMGKKNGLKNRIIFNKAWKTLPKKMESVPHLPKIIVHNNAGEVCGFY